MLLLPLCPFGTPAWWSVAQQPEARLDAGEHYPKRTFRNRIALHGPNGPEQLTVGVKRRGSVPKPQDETVRVTGDAGRKMWRAIRTTYGSAPYFEEMAEELEPLILNGPETLGAWNRATLDWAAQWLGASVPPDAPLDGVDRFGVQHERSLTDWSTAWMAIARPWPHIWQDRMTPHFSGLSVLDLILHCGPESRQWIIPLTPSESPHRG